MRKAYKEYKATGIQWLPKIPRHWDLRRNKNIFTEHSEVVGSNSNEYDLLSLTLGGVIRRDLNAGGKFSATYDKYKIVKKGDMIFCLFDIDETPRTVGLSEYNGMITGAYTIMEINNINPLYVYFYYLSLDNNKLLKPLYTGLRKTIKANVFQSVKLPVPPREEQEQIVRFLDWKISSINKLINIKQQEINNLKELKKATISDAITHGLNKTVPMKDSGIAWIGKIPQHWNVKRLKYISLKHFSGTWGNECDGSSNDKNCIRVADFNFENLTLSISKPTKRNYTCGEIRKYALQDGDILVEKSGGGRKTPVDRAIYYNLNGSFLYANFIEMIRVKQQNSKFLVYLLAYMYHSGYINTMYNQTTGIQNLDISKYINQQIVLPPP